MNLNEIVLVSPRLITDSDDMTKTFDILVNGRVAMTLWATSAEAAIIEAYLLGLNAGETDNVKAMARIHGN